MKYLRRVALLVVSCMIVCLFYSEVVLASYQGEDEQLILDYYQAIDNQEWNTWLSLLGTSYADNMEYHLMDKSYQDNNRGVLAIDKIQDILNIQAIEILGYESIVNSCEGECHELYLVQTEITVNSENEFYFNGINYNVIIVGTVDGSRKIVGVRLPLMETIAKYQTENEARTYEKVRLGNTAPTRAIDLTNCSYNTTPSTIIVWRWYYGNGSYETVDFNRYVKVVIAAEYGYVNRDADYHYTGALAIKTYAINKIMTADPNAAYHVTDTNRTDSTHIMSCQVYNPGEYWNSSTWGTLYTRVDNVWSKNIFGTGYTRMDTQYRSGTGSGNSGILYQTKANELANAGKTYEDILNYFYGSSRESSGDIVLVESGTHVYYKSTVLSDGTYKYYCRCGYIRNVTNLHP